MEPKSDEPLKEVGSAVSVIRSTADLRKDTADTFKVPSVPPPRAESAFKHPSSIKPLPRSSRIADQVRRPSVIAVNPLTQLDKGNGSARRCEETVDFIDSNEDEAAGAEKPTALEISGEGSELDGEKSGDRDECAAELNAFMDTKDDNAEHSPKTMVTRSLENVEESDVSNTAEQAVSQKSANEVIVEADQNDAAEMVESKPGEESALNNLSVDERNGSRSCENYQKEDGTHEEKTGNPDLGEEGKNAIKVESTDCLEGSDDSDTKHTVCDKMCALDDKDIEMVINKVWEKENMNAAKEEIPIENDQKNDGNEGTSSEHGEMQFSVGPSGTDNLNDENNKETTALDDRKGNNETGTVTEQMDCNIETLEGHNAALLIQINFNQSNVEFAADNTTSQSNATITAIWQVDQTGGNSNLNMDNNETMVEGVANSHGEINTNRSSQMGIQGYMVPVAPVQTPEEQMIIHHQQVRLKKKIKAYQMLYRGKLSLMNKDYKTASFLLGKACKKIGSLFGDQAVECTEPYVLYGNALFDCYRTLASKPQNGEKSGNKEAAKEDNVEPKKNETENQPEANTAAKDASEGRSVDEEDEGEAKEILQTAWEIMEVAKKICMKSGNSLNFAKVCKKLGEIRIANNKPIFAEHELERSLSSQKTLRVPDLSLKGRTHMQLSRAAKMYCAFEKALADLELARSCFEESLTKLLKTPESRRSFNCGKQIEELRHALKEVEAAKAKTELQAAEFENQLGADGDDGLEAVGKHQVIQSIIDSSIADLMKERSTSSDYPDNTKDHSVVSANNISHLIRKKPRARSSSAPEMSSGAPRKRIKLSGDQNTASSSKESAKKDAEKQAAEKEGGGSGEGDAEKQQSGAKDGDVSMKQ